MEPAVTASTTHTYRPAHVSEGKHSYQRRFGVPQHDDCHPSALSISVGRVSGAFSVYRDGTEDVAEVRLAIGTHTRASIDLRMTPAELREAAARLLDAAHDIEANPAAALQRQAQGGAA